MTDDTPDVDNPTLVGTPQAGAAAGGEPTSGNEENPETQVEDPTESDEPDGDPDDDDGGSSESDETAPALSRARSQAARYRRELRDTEAERDELAAALWTARVDQLGVLADPDDLPFDPDALHDPDRLRELVDELVTEKPHLKSRRIRARAGQGEGSAPDGISLAAILNRGA